MSDDTCSLILGRLILVSLTFIRIYFTSQGHKYFFSSLIEMINETPIIITIKMNSLHDWWGRGPSNTYFSSSFVLSITSLMWLVFAKLFTIKLNLFSMSLILLLWLMMALIRPLFWFLLCKWSSFLALNLSFWRRRSASNANLKTWSRSVWLNIKWLVNFNLITNTKPDWGTGSSPIWLSPIIGESPGGILANIHLTFDNWRMSWGYTGESQVEIRQYWWKSSGHSPILAIVDSSNL